MRTDAIGAKIVDKRRFWEARVEMAVFKRPSSELSVYDKLVYAVLCGHANRDGNAMLFVRTIADEASCSERQVQRAMTTLEKRGLLVRSPQYQEGRQVFNIYEVYGFDAYIPDPATEDGDDDEETARGIGVTDSHPCQTVTLPPTEGHPRGDCVAGLNNVFEQPLFNNSQKNIPPLPPTGGNEGIGDFLDSKPKGKKHLTEARNKSGDTQEREAHVCKERESPERILQESILSAYNEILPELPEAGTLTASRARALNQRIREDPRRIDPAWWRSYFERVRRFPWLMGDNPHGWKASFDWLTGEDGMNKVLEGHFTTAQTSRESRAGCSLSPDEQYALQRKYTNGEGIVDAAGLFQEWGELEARGGRNP